MFSGKSFNQYIGNWNFPNVISLKWMFSNAYEFNQDISNWNVSNVRDIEECFQKQQILIVR